MSIALTQNRTTVVFNNATGTSSVYGVTHLDTLELNLEGTGSVSIQTCLTEDGTFVEQDTITDALPQKSIDIRSNCVKFVTSDTITLRAQGQRVNR